MFNKKFSFGNKYVETMYMGSLSFYIKSTRVKRQGARKVLMKVTVVAVMARLSFNPPPEMKKIINGTR